MQLQLHVKVRQVDVAKALEESSRGTRTFSSEIIYQAILRAIGYHAHTPIRVAYGGIAITLPGREGEMVYHYRQPCVTHHMMKWNEMEAQNPPWSVERRGSHPIMPDFDFDLPLDSSVINFHMSDVEGHIRSNGGQQPKR